MFCFRIVALAGDAFPVLAPLPPTTSREAATMTPAVSASTARLDATLDLPDLTQLAAANNQQTTALRTSRGAV
jgi:hypothetical protein